MAVSECERLKTLVIPKNNENICWWLSVNLALFHKQRPELEDFNGKPVTEQQRILLNVYNHYSGKGNQDVDFLSTGARDNLAAASASASASSTPPGGAPPNPTYASAEEVD